MSPKLSSVFEELRGQVKKELAPMLARQEAERKRKATEAPGRPDAARAELLPPERPPAVVTAPAAMARKLPVLPFVFLGAGAVAGGTGAVFGWQSQQQIASARAAVFQDDRVARLGAAQTSATIANVLFVVAAAAGIGTVVGFVARHRLLRLERPGAAGPDALVHRSPR